MVRRAVVPRPSNVSSRARENVVPIVGPRSIVSVARSASVVIGSTIACGVSRVSAESRFRERTGLSSVIGSSGGSVARSLASVVRSRSVRLNRIVVSLA